MRRNNGIGPRPIVERICLRYDQVGDSLVTAEVGFFVDGMAVEVESPGLNVAPGNQVNDSFSICARGQSLAGEALFELATAMTNVSSVGIYRHQEGALRRP